MHEWRAGDFLEPEGEQDDIRACAHCGEAVGGEPVWRTEQFIKTGSRERQEKPKWLVFCSLEHAREARDKAAMAEAGQRWADGVCEVAAAVNRRDCWWRGGKRMTRNGALEWDRKNLSPEAFAHRWPQEVGR